MASPALPFTREEFFTVFAAYNEAVWPAQAVLAAAALLAIWAAASGRGRTATWLLAALWAWTALVYHWSFFRAINPAAGLFAAAFLAQAALFVLVAAGGGLRMGPVVPWRRAAGWAALAFAALGYPLWGLAAGHPARELPLLGTPCPTTILTLGLLLLADPAPPRWCLAIPLLWGAVGGSAALLLGVPQDLGLLVVAALSLPLLRRPAPVRR